MIPTGLTLVVMGAGCVAAAHRLNPSRLASCESQVFAAEVSLLLIGCVLLIVGVTLTVAAWVMR